MPVVVGVEAICFLGAVIRKSVRSPLPWEAVSQFKKVSISARHAGFAIKMRIDLIRHPPEKPVTKISAPSTKRNSYMYIETHKNQLPCFSGCPYQ
jgi:hypothetical protein